MHTLDKFLLFVAQRLVVLASTVACA